MVLSHVRSSEPLLEIKNLTVSYNSGQNEQTAVRDASFSIQPGERIALIGESGSGKSTIGNSILGLLPPNAETSTEAELIFDGRNLLELKNSREWNHFRGTRIGFVPQDPTIALNPVKKVGVQIAGALRLHGLKDKVAAYKKTLELIDQVGIREPESVFHSYPFQLSGGMRQRILIASAISLEPQLIIADEPTSGLDVTVQKLILDLLDDLVQSQGVSVILITHDLAVAQQRTDKVVILKDGETVESGLTNEVIQHSQNEYTKQLFESAPATHHDRLTPTKLHASTVSTDAELTELLRIEDINKTYKRKSARGSRVKNQALTNVSLSILKGESFGVVGESGSGKTTTAKIIAGIEKPDSGRISWRGTDITDLNWRQRKPYLSKIQYLFQNPFSSLDPKFTLKEILEEPLRYGGSAEGESNEELIHKTLDAVNIPLDYLRRKPTELSGGQRQRIAIARAVVGRPELLVLDEPVSALDVTVQSQVLQLLVDLQHEFNLSYLFISHDLAVVRLLCDRVLVMKQGEAIEVGPVDQIFDQAKDLYTQQLIEAIPSVQLTEAI